MNECRCRVKAASITLQERICKSIPLAEDEVWVAHVHQPSAY
jgi:hypothetical protein